MVLVIEVFEWLNVFIVIMCLFCVWMVFRKVEDVCWLYLLLGISVVKWVMFLFLV